MNIADIRGAVARGWCHPDNASKVMDVDLAEAIAQEVATLAAREDGWRPIESAPTGDEFILAATSDGRVMVYRASILARNIAGPTPSHLQFPADWWKPITLPTMSAMDRMVAESEKAGLYDLPAAPPAQGTGEGCG